MSESETAKKARKLLKGIDDLVGTVIKDTTEIIKAAKDLKDTISPGMDEKEKRK